MTSRQVWETVTDRLSKGESISRASIIFFLNDMVDEGVLEYVMESGRGGDHKVYSPKMDEEEYVKYLVRTICGSLIRDYSKETKKIISEIKKINSVFY